MHIGFLTPEYPTPDKPEGGLANYLRKTGFALAKRGHRISVFVISDQDKIWLDGPVEVYEIRRASPPRRFFPTRLNMRQFRGVVSQYLSSRRLATRVREIHHENSIDILQASSYMAPGYVLLHNNRIPMVCRISSYTPLWRSASGRQRVFNEYLSDWMEIRQVLDADAAFAPSELTANTFTRIKGFRPDIIRTPFDSRTSITDESFYQDYIVGFRYLLYFGSLNRIKGTDLLAEIIPFILRKYTNLSIIFIGRDDGLPNGQKVFDYLLSHCDSNKDRLLYFPPIPKSKLFPIVANAIGVLMPSRIDNYPNACLEAQSFGVPVVGTYDSSIDEMIVNGETGFLATNGDSNSLYKAIECLLALTISQRKRMQKRILDSVRSIRGEDRIGKLENFYRQVIDDFVTK